MKAKVRKNPLGSETSTVLSIEEPKHWLILGTTLVLLTLLLIWSIFGRIPTEATGRSVSLSSGGVFTVQATANGAVVEIFVSEGDWVKKGEPLAKVANPKIGSLLTSIDSTKFKIEKLEAEAVLLQHALDISEGLFQKGLVAKLAIDKSKSALMQKEIQIEEAKSSLDNFFAELELNTSTGKENFIRQKALLETMTLPTDFGGIEESLMTLFAPSNSNVLEVLVNQGELVSSKQPLIWMEYPPEPGEPELFYGTLPSDTIGNLKEGLKVLIEPSSVNPREYGAIIGRVEAIHPYPVSKAEIMQNIGNTQIVEYLLAKGNTKTQILIAPELDPDTVSGYEWTSKKGPPFEIAPGTICKIRVTIDEQPPISYLIPLWKIKP